MLNATRTPVKVYRWDDEGAPQLDWAGGLVKTILKACLSTGYGSGESRKEPLGWNCLYEEEMKAVFLPPSPLAEGWALSLDDSVMAGNEDRINGHVLAAMIKQPSSLTEGAQVGNTYKCGVHYLPRSSDKNTKWVLAGNERGFMLVFFGGYSSACLGFGGFADVLPAAACSSVLLISGKDWGYAGPISAALIGAAASSADANLNSAAHMSSPASYPSAISGGFASADCWIYEKIGSEYTLRGLCPGLLRIAEKMPSESVLPAGTLYLNLDDSGDEYVYFRDYPDYGGWLLNLTAWEM